MRKELIDKLFNKFEKDKDTIKNNLLQVMNYVYLTSEDESETIKLEIKIDRKVKRINDRYN